MILKEEGGEAGEGSGTPAVIPEELKFGFKDEMGKEEQKREEKENALDVWSTAPTEIVSTSEPAISEPPPAASVVAATTPASHIPEPPSAQMPQLQPSPTRPIPPSPSNGSPGWLDKAITGVAAALAVMVIKKVALS